jgi:hypothetical protein
VTPTNAADSATRAVLPVKIMERKEMLRNVLNVHLLISSCMQPNPSASQAVVQKVDIPDTMKSIRTPRLDTVIATSANLLVLSARVTNRTAHGANGIQLQLEKSCLIQNLNGQTHQLCL